MEADMKDEGIGRGGTSAETMVKIQGGESWLRLCGAGKVLDDPCVCVCVRMCMWVRVTLWVSEVI